MPPTNRIIFPHTEDTSAIEYCAQSLNNTKGITIGSLNIRSVTRKIDELQILLNRSNIDVLALNETFLNASIFDGELAVPGYRAFRHDRLASSGKIHGGGILVYCKEGRDITPIDGGTYCTANIESMWLELKLPNSRPTAICSVYRPPDSKLEDSLIELQNQYDKLEISHRSDIIIIGDINVDMSKTSPNKTKLVNFMKVLKLEQLITQPTRVTAATNTIIDHIWCNNPMLYSHRGVIDSGMSDHSLIFCCRKRKKLTKERKTIEIRSRRNFDQIAFENDVANIDWTEVLDCDNIELAAEYFQIKFMEVVDRHMPIIKVRMRSQQPPWISSGFLSLIDAREYRARILRKYPTAENSNALKLAKLAVQKLKRSLKKSFIESSLHKHQGDPKKLWRTIRTFWPNSRGNSSYISSMNGFTDDAKIADFMNDFFCNTGNRIQSQITSDATLNEFDIFHRPPVFDFNMITKSDISDAINRLSSSPSSSIDHITAYMIKASKTGLLDVLEYLFNLSLSQRQFPSCWKISKVTPLLKSGNPSDVNNYRPISIIPTVGKILERIVHKQSSDYLKSYNILTDAQSGFRPGHSTGTCMISFLDEIYSKIDIGEAVGTLFIDLSKAFASIDHAIMSEKLAKMGFRLGPIKWFESYLTGRRQVTRVNSNLSSETVTSCGVPQGSILGPLLFICYTNDLPSHLQYTRPSIYADDTALLSFGSSVTEIELNLQSDINILHRWFDANKLSLNRSKSKAMLFCSNRHRDKDTQLNVTIDGEVLETVTSFKYLGMELDNHLSFSNHVDRVCGKVSQRTGLLWRVRPFISQNLAKQLYTSLIEPHFIYLDYIYDGCSKGASNKLQICQNNALRAVMRTDSRHSTQALHTDTNTEWLDIMRKKSTCLQVFKSLNNHNPDKINNMFAYTCQTRHLRSHDSQTLARPRTRTVKADSNIRVRGAVYWSDLDTTVQKSTSVANFKNRIKKFEGVNHN